MRGCSGIRRLIPAIAAIAVLSVGASPAHADQARITAEERTGPRVVTLTISTPAFTTPTKVDVDLPAGYAALSGRRWPVTYFLAGTMNTYHTFNSFVDGVKLTESYPSILVSPNGDSGYWSDWYNAGSFGPPMYETYVIDQLIPLIDAHFRTIADRSQRAVLGISMGGYGAMMVAARHPDLFAAAASLSGAVDSNLAANGAVLSASPEFQGAQPDAIYGPRATQEVRWHGHNPTDLANNLRGMDLQVRSANGTPNPGIGENLLSADTVSCVVEAGVYMASTDLHNTLDTLHIPHIWRDYGAGCHTAPNFERELTDTFQIFAKVFAHPPAPPAAFDYESIEPAFDVWGWHIAADPTRALEFLQLHDVGDGGLTLAGSGTTTIVTPPLFRGVRQVDLANAAPATVAPDAVGRIRFTVDLGAPDAQQQYTPGAANSPVTRAVTFAPHAVIEVSRVRQSPRHVRICARAIGGSIAARLRVLGPRKRAAVRSAKVRLTPRTSCRALRRTRQATGGRGELLISGTDRFGHTASYHRTIRLIGAPRARR